MTAMPRVYFTPNLKRHIDCPTGYVDGSTVLEALNQIFADNTRLRGYVLDDQDRLRTNMLVAVDGEMVRDRIRLSDAVKADSEIYVIQALSGG